MTFTVRRFRDGNGGTDLERLIALVQAAWDPERRPAANFHVGDLLWRLREPSYARNLWLWEDRKELAGFAEWNEAEKSLETQTHPRYAGAELDAQMLHWAEAAPRPDGGANGLSTLAAEANTSLVAMLNARGFERQENYINHHRCFLDVPLNAAPPLPDGYQVRHLASGTEEVAARVQGHRAGWQSEKMTIEHYRRLMNAPGYRPELDIVVVAPDGAFVATGNCWLDERSGAGLFEPVSTHPDHRRRGLGRALIHHGLQQLQALGGRTAWVVSVARNPAATRLYERCGMAVVRRDFEYQKPD